MSDLKLDYDPILEATFQTLELKRPAIAALNKLAGKLDKRAARYASELATQIDRDRIYGARDLLAFEPVLEAASRVIAAGRVRKIDVKELGDPDVYWTLTEDALKVHNLREDVAALHEALSRLHAVRRAEVLALRFRTEDAA